MRGSFPTISCAGRRGKSPAPGGELPTPRLSIAAAASAVGISTSQFAQVATTYSYVAFWILASAGVILYNKWILTVWGFTFPITLTMWHMAFCSVVSAILVRARRQKALGRWAATCGAILRLYACVC